jgi:hypothetical protein
MHEAGQVRYARQGRADARGKAVVCPRQGRADAISKAGKMREARQGGCARQGRADPIG